MTTEVDEALTEKVAHLARISLSPEELRTFSSQLGHILHYIEKLQEVNVEGVEPLVHPLKQEEGTQPFLRPDECLESLRDEAGQPKMLQSAPEVLQGGFKVPPIL